MHMHPPTTAPKKNPVVAVASGNVTGVELLIDTDARVVQFCPTTCAEKGFGRKMVEAVIAPT
jgi:hypothetical protein